MVSRNEEIVKELRERKKEENDERKRKWTMRQIENKRIG